MVKCMKTLTIKIISQLKTQEDFRLGIGQFLDDFKYTFEEIGNHSKCQSMIEDEPISNEMLAKHQYALLAGLVEYLCNRYPVKKPAWIFDDKYYLKEPYFSGDAKGKMRLVYLIESPTELRARNYFASYNAFSRA